MAVKGSGLGKGPDEGEFKDQTSYAGARSGAAKKTQTSFDQKWGMKDQTKLSGIGPSDPGTGPVAGGTSTNPLDPETPAQRGKTLRRQPAVLQSSWGMKDANGKGVDNSLGGKVIGEAILSGSAKLPASESFSSAGPGRQPG